MSLVSKIKKFTQSVAGDFIYKYRMMVVGLGWLAGDGMLTGKNKFSTGNWFNNMAEFLAGTFFLTSTAIFILNTKEKLLAIRAGCFAGLMGCVAWCFDPKMQNKSGIASIGLLSCGVGINMLMPEAKKLCGHIATRFSQSLPAKVDLQNVPSNTATAMMFVSRAPLIAVIVQNKDYVLAACLVAWSIGDIALCNPPIFKRLCGVKENAGR